MHSLSHFHELAELYSLKFDNGGNFAVEIVINDYGRYLEKDVIVNYVKTKLINSWKINCLTFTMLLSEHIYFSDNKFRNLKFTKKLKNAKLINSILFSHIILAELKLFKLFKLFNSNINFLKIKWFVFIRLINFIITNIWNNIYLFILF